MSAAAVAAAEAVVEAVAEADVADAAADVTTATKPLGIGIGWRPEIALFIDRRDDISWVEVVAENVMKSREIPRAIAPSASAGRRSCPMASRCRLAARSRWTAIG